MPRTVPTALKARIESGAWCPALLVKVSLKSGENLCYTSADTDIVFGGDTYIPDDGIRMTGFSQTLGSGVDNTQSSGFNDDARLDYQEAMLGVLDGATYVVYICDFENIDDGVIVMATGPLGDVTITDQSFEIDHFGLTAYLKRTVARSTSKTCSCRKLGDFECRVNLSGNVQGRPIRSLNQNVSTVVSQKKIAVSNNAPSTFYQYGYVTFTTGANVGIEREIKKHDNVSGVALIETVLPFPAAISVGDKVTLTAGCNRKLKYNSGTELKVASTCSEFGNGVNYRGEFYLPGNDSLTQIGGQS